jgi:hypothetical protein
MWWKADQSWQYMPIAKDCHNVGKYSEARLEKTNTGYGEWGVVEELLAVPGLGGAVVMRYNLICHWDSSMVVYRIALESILQSEYRQDCSRVVGMKNHGPIRNNEAWKAAQKDAKSFVT